MQASFSDRDVPAAEEKATRCKKDAADPVQNQNTASAAVAGDQRHGVKPVSYTHLVVDLRPTSESFGKWFGLELSAENKKQLYVPQGFAHGFLVLSDEAEFTYKCTDYYAPGDEGGLYYADPDIGVQWPEIGTPHLLSDKDQKNPAFAGQDFSFFDRW